MKLHTQISGDGKPLIILHGFLGMGDNWKSLSKQYIKKGFEVHLLDMRNHGKSPHSNNFNYDVMVEDIYEYFTFHKIEKAAVIGHSMGGKIAMQFASKYPECLSELIIVDISPKLYHPHHDEILESLKLLQTKKLTSRQDADDVLKIKIKEQGVRLFLLKNLKREDDNSLTLKPNIDVFLKNRKEIGRELPENCIYHSKTLFIKGAQSHYIREKDQKLIQKHFPNFKISTVPNAGHWVHAENPTDFLKTSLSFLAN